MTKPERVTKILRLDADLAKRLDVKRGELSLNAFLVKIIEEHLAPRKAATPKPLTEGHVRKGGINPPESQVTERPDPPAPIHAAQRGWLDLMVGKPRPAFGDMLKKSKGK